MPEDLLEAVRSGYHAGLCLLPTKNNGSKCPDLSTWEHYKAVRPANTEMRAFHFEHRTGFGMIAGPVSGRRGAWDFDDLETYRAFVAAAEASGLGDVVRRIEAGYCDETPRGGRRWIVTYPAGVEWHDQTFARRPPARPGESVKTLIECPTFAILAPSNGGTHPSGRPYVRLSGGFPLIASVSADEHDALQTLARSFDEMPRRACPEARSNPAAGTTGDRPGDDFKQRATWPQILEPAGWRHVYDRGEVACWCRPGKRHGISATTNIAGTDLLYVFSSSTAFESETSYSKFAAYAVLNHGGDFKAATRALGKQGYGAPRVAGGASDYTPGHPPTLPADDDEEADLPALATTWPAPLSRSAYLGIYGDIVDAIAPHTEADPAALLLQLLAMFGNVIGRTAHFRVEADTHYLSLYVALVGKTSKGRKGVSAGQARRFFGPIDETWTKDCHASGLSTGEGLIAVIRDAVEKQQPIREHKRIVGYETVIEDHGVSDKRLYVDESELASTLKVMMREGNTLSPVVRNAWDGKTLRTMTKASPLRATGPHVTIIGSITQQEVRRYLDATESANGFGNRFLWVCVQRAQYLPDGGAYVPVDALAERLRGLVTRARDVGEMERDSDARTFWYQVYRPLSAERQGLLGSLTARAEAQVMRLACLYALGDGSHSVRRPHLEAALEVWRYCFDSAACIFGDSLGDRQADTLLAALKAAGPTGLTRSDIINGVFQKNLSATDLRRIVTLLREAALAICRHEDSRGGRRAERWFYARDGYGKNGERPDADPEAGTLSVKSVHPLAESTFAELFPDPQPADRLSPVPRTIDPPDPDEPEEFDL